MDNVITLDQPAKDNGSYDPVWAATDELKRISLEMLGNYEDAATAHVMAAVDHALDTKDPKNIAIMGQWLRNVADRLDQEIDN